MADDVARRHAPSAWWLGALAGAVSATLMVLESLNIAPWFGGIGGPSAALIVVTSVAVGLYRIQPGVGLALVWGIGVLHLISGAPVLASHVAVGLLAYGVGRYGSRVVVVLGALSIFAAFPVGLALVSRIDEFDPRGIVELSPWIENAVSIGGFGSLTVTVLLVLAVPLVVPALVGIAFRMWDRSRQSVAAMEEAQYEQAVAREREQQAQELAELRAGQARLARDVHDVVGHSLTVILAQAQSAQYLDRDLHPDVGRALGAIADTARASLADVRSILTATQEQGPSAGEAGAVPPDFQRMIEDVRAAGTPLNVETRGQVRPLAPDHAVTLYRVLQEMLTNVLKHGAPGHDVDVTFDWRSALAVRIVNEAAADSESEPGSGDRRGLEGMKARMAAIGGTLAAERTGTRFTVTATFPHAGERSGDIMGEADRGVR
ncbi:sensor histidine kinase [Demequina aestuarii]|uniref:sensor histidine kinase n=1 Tax=Demequina aestuarii TaxID=327095 RepID=UPI0007848430|nr:histidine kinase [Demequina aestuarii]